MEAAAAAAAAGGSACAWWRVDGAAASRRWRRVGGIGAGHECSPDGPARPRCGSCELKTAT